MGVALVGGNVTTRQNLGGNSSSKSIAIPEVQTGLTEIEPQNYVTNNNFE